MHRPTLVTVSDYAIRIGCFAYTMVFTFVYQVWPAAMIGWVAMVILFILDFF